MIPVLLIGIPLVAGLINFFIKGENGAKNFALFASLATLVVMLMALNAQPNQLSYDAVWLPSFKANFSLHMDGMSKMLCLLTAFAMPLVLWATSKNQYKNAHQFYALMLLSQAGLMGVFVAYDALLFYFFWELALIPVYFLASIWGGEKRVQATFKFFIYTFVGSLIMLVGILLVYYNMASPSFAWNDFTKAALSPSIQMRTFWMFFIAFAIKMPIFPLHTWQPDAYEQSPTAVTMILSGVMVKMGLFAVLRWLIPVFPQAVIQFQHIIILLSVIGILYASFIAMQQDDIKRMIAYSSIAHIGLMSAAIFTQQKIALDGVMIQMFNHGINVIGLWIVADVIEQQYQTRKMSQLGGLAKQAPVLAILLVVLAFANVALPLTNAFVGEFLMFNGLFRYNLWMALAAGISIIIAAVYTLNMVQKVFYGEVSDATQSASEVKATIQLPLICIVGMIVVFGVYPQPMFQLTKDTVQFLTQLISH